MDPSSSSSRMTDSLMREGTVRTLSSLNSAQAVPLPALPADWSSSRHCGAAGAESGLVAGGVAGWASPARPRRARRRGSGRPRQPGSGSGPGAWPGPGTAPWPAAALPARAGRQRQRRRGGRGGVGQRTLDLHRGAGLDLRGVGVDPVALRGGGLHLVHRRAVRRAVRQPQPQQLPRLLVGACARWGGVRGASAAGGAGGAADIGS